MTAERCIGPPTLRASRKLRTSGDTISRMHDPTIVRNPKPTIVRMLRSHDRTKPNSTILRSQETENLQNSECSRERRNTREHALNRMTRSYDRANPTILRSCENQIYDPTIVRNPKPYDPTIVENRTYELPCVHENVGTHGIVQAPRSYDRAKHKTHDPTTV
jgi:hypothetical protein